MATKKNLIKSRDEYTRYYGDFRGVDFSSDHAQVHPQRLAYLVNMYKDYRSGEGNSLETIPGFRRMVCVNPDYDEDLNPIYSKTNGIHEFNFMEDGERKQEIYIHVGTKLCKWDDLSLSQNVNKKLYYQISNVVEDNDGNITLEIPDDARVCHVISITSAYGTDYHNPIKDGIEISNYYELGSTTITLKPNNDETKASLWGNYVIVNYIEAQIRIVNNSLADNPSVSFQFNNCLFVIDGEHYWRIERKTDEQKTSVTDILNTGVYVPTIYKDVDIASTDPIDKYEYEQRNMLIDSFKHTYIADGTTKTYHLYYPAGSISEVKVYGETLTSGKDYTVSSNYDSITFTNAPKTPVEATYPEGYAGVEIYAHAKDDQKKVITKCSIATIFDKRVFLSGNPDYPNHIFYCGINNENGREDPTYFGELNFVQDGVEVAPITAMVPVADTLAVLKNHAKQDGSVYFHSRFETSRNAVPVTYPAVQGLSGVSCLGAAVNFLDDPVFISPMGVEGIGQLSVRLERAIEHRSSLIDAKLCNLDLSKAKLVEWNGYLVVLCDGKIFLADSRQTYAHESGAMQYEWYYLEGIGVYENQEKEYYFSSYKPDGLAEEITVANAVYDDYYGHNLNLVNTPVYVEGLEETRIDDVYKTIDLLSLEDGRFVTKKVLCEFRGSYTGGTFHPATTITNINGNLYFGTDHGVVCAFNFDQRGEDGLFSPRWYSFDERTIISGCATKMDNCDVPHLAKSTIKKSTVIRTKALPSSAMKVKIRTNKRAYNQIARVNTRTFTFDDVDFSDFSFASEEQTIHPIKEKEKHWVEKQHFIYTDEYQKPLSLQYIAFRYKIAGRVKG